MDPIPSPGFKDTNSSTCSDDSALGPIHLVRPRFRDDLRTPLSWQRSTDSFDDEYLLGRAFQIMGGLSLGGPGRCADLSAYVKACFGFRSESSHCDFRAFQLIGLELGTDPLAEWPVSLGSVFLAARLYIETVGTSNAFVDGLLDEAQFRAFLAKHLGISAEVIAGAIDPDDVRA